MPRLLLFVATTIIFVNSLHAVTSFETTQTLKLMSVAVDVTGHRAKEVESFLKRELRSLGDIEIVGPSDYSDHSISVVSVKVSVGTDNEVGISLAILVHKPVFNFLPKFLVDTSVPDSTMAELIKESIVSETEDAVIIDRFSNWIVGRDELQERIQTLVAEIDIETFEPARERIRKSLREVSKRSQN